MSKPTKDLRPFLIQIENRYLKSKNQIKGRKITKLPKHGTKK